MSQDTRPLRRKGISLPIGQITLRVLCKGAPHGATQALRTLGVTHQRRWWQKPKLRLHLKQGLLIGHLIPDSRLVVLPL